MTNVGRAPLLVASNRGPLTVVAVDDGDDEIRRGSGGLVSGMQAALSVTPDAVWVSAAMNDRERALARQAPEGRIGELPFVAEALRGDFDVQMLPIDALTFRNAYNGVANSTLWFVLHRLYDLPTQPSFDANWRRQWNSYVRFNEAFANALAAAAAPNATVMVQDYHLFLVPRMLRNLRSDVRIGLFTHTPWVSPDDFAMLPDDVAFALVDGMLGADVIGFHTERWAQLFRDTAQAVAGVDAPGVAVFPLGTDPDEMHRLGSRRSVDSALRVLDDIVGDRLLIGRVDRTELSKNVYRGLLAFRELLRTRPEWHGRVVHAVYNNPSREDVPAYREYTARIERLASDIDDEFSTDDWTPLVFEIGDDYPAALAVLRRSDVVFVNSVRDGMNLVVLEGLVLSERSPAVVLSRETGAAEVLGGDAITVNPFDVSATARALNDALLMPMDERTARADRMRAAAIRLPPTDWFQAQLDALSGRVDLDVRVGRVLDITSVTDSGIDPAVDAARLSELFGEHAARVLAYAGRHVDAHTAQDVVSEVFLTAWRRLAEVPDDPLPWLLVTARNMIHNRSRGVTRQQRLARRIRFLAAAAATSPGADDTVVERQTMVTALAQLSEREREAVLLIAWDGLSVSAAAQVAGCSRHAFEVRLHRARGRLRRVLDDPDPVRPDAAHVPSVPTSQELTS